MLDFSRPCTIEAGWGTMFWTFLAVFVFLMYWGKIDGTEKWERKEKERQQKAEEEGWRKWHEGKWRMGEQS